MVKLWDMDNVNLLTSTDADGGLPASPSIRFNKEGILLAVSTNDNGIKILANSDGIRLLRTVDASRAASVAVVKASAIGTFGSSNITVGTGIGDRAAPVPAMVGLINGILSLQNVESTSIKHNRRACDCCKNRTY
ncbi:topless-related protein 4-like [Rosa rugosa]|uniref:topless-related protein 4-like n=1 Tax=Rosa rugosa TaxID=74645 RepID=UPI002B40B75D|nr:topless-related protein 4-like [Rosa rugosa]XP_061996378.1 topless-related protein 4-like [Rosa rugosa]XP_061996379.1 topless-related protein 4-like [Rosa rugosa]